MAGTIKISELDALTVAQNSTIIPVVDGGVTKKMSLSILQTALTGSFATDAELSAQISSVNSTISGLTTTEISEGTRLYYTDARVKTKLNTEGIISGSAQITITESQISDLTHYTDADVLDYINQLEIVSGSIITELPTGLVSSSQQVKDLLPEGTVSGSQQITDSINSTINSTVNSSYIKNRLPENTISSSQQVTDYLPENTISSSQQVTDYLPEGVVSGSQQLTDFGFIDELPQNLISSSQQVTDYLPEGIISSSQQITDFGFITESVATSLPQGVVSSSQQVTDYLPEGIVSSSQQVTDYLPENIISSSQQISDLGFITDAGTIPDGTVSSSIQVKDYLPDGTVSSSIQVKDYLPEETISSSQQVKDLLPDGIVSGSSQITITESQISDLDHYTDADVLGYINQLVVVSGSLVTQLPNGLVSSSQQVIDYLPTDLISSSQQVKDLLPQGTISSSNQLPTYLTEGDFSTVSQSFSQRITNFESIEIISQSSQIDYKNIQNKLSFVGLDGISISQSIEEVNISIDSVSYVNLTNIPQGIISGSDQIAAENFIKDSDLNSPDGIKTLTVVNNTTITDFAATFLDDTDAAGVKTTLGIQELDYAKTGSNTFEGSQQINANLIVTGSANVGQVLQLSVLDTLPAGVSGQLAVSASGALRNLYFYNGAAWREVAFV